MEQGGEQFDVIAIGDTTEDIFLQMSEASLQCDLNGKDCKICFDFANKIPVEKKTDVPAVGNAANHAVGVARLGLKSALYTVVGEDDAGKRAQKVLAENGVDTTYMEFDPKHGTNLSMVINYRSERTIFVYHEPREYTLPQLSQTKWIYLTSAAKEGLSSLHEQVLSFLQSHREVRVAFNPGTHQMHMGRQALAPLLERCDVLFLNREESALVLEEETNDIRELMRSFHGLGVRTMVITDGSQGAYASDGRTIWYVPVFDGPVVERTGAGDSFGSGFLSAIVCGKSIEEAMLWGNANATSVVQHIGAREGLLTREALMAMIAEQPSIRPKKF